jgi:1-acylglycerone phosphate reductase
MTALPNLGIDTLTLDVLSDASIKSCVEQVAAFTASTSGGLGVLINNAGGGYNMPVADIDSLKPKLSSTSTSGPTSPSCRPLLLQAKGVIVNNTSISSVAPTPFSSVYHASKAAAAMFSDHQRIECAPFGVHVVDLKTGSVKSNFHNNRSDESRLPNGSVYEPMRAEAERAICAEHFSKRMDLDVWAEQVVSDLLKKNPPAQVWSGKDLVLGHVCRPHLVGRGVQQGGGIGCIGEEAGDAGTVLMRVSMAGQRALRGFAWLGRWYCACC